MLRILSSFLACWLFVSIAGAADPLRVVIATDGAPTSQKLRESLTKDLKARGVEASTADVSAAMSLRDANVLVLFESEMTPLIPENRSIVEAFARGGGGLVVLHGAIAAGDAPWWQPLVGGAWTGASRKFTNRELFAVASDQHPIVGGASPFDITDETLYDLDLRKDVIVLASAFTPKITNGRDEPEKTAPAPGAQRANVFDIQPQMWAYEAPPEGSTPRRRAFVALPGAAETLEHPSYRTFLLRGISWAAGRPELDEFSQPADVAALRYPPGGPETPEKTAAQFQIEPGFKATVAAAEPLITKPIAVQWDGSGRLWVAETPEYPNGRRPLVAPPWKETDSLMPGVTERPAHDRISILSDPDASGRFTKKTVFYEGLELVTGFCLYRDGVIALHEPDIVWIRDTTGQGKADKVERLYTGFSPGDTHFVANHLIAAPDGWIYASMGGGADARNPQTGKPMAQITSGMFRFKPDGSAIEQVSSKGGNGFGADVTTDGELFFGQATSGNPVQHVVVPERTLALGKVGVTGSAQNVIEQRKVVHPLPDRIPFMQIDMVGMYSAACASLIYEGGAWGREWDRSIFCTEPILNIVHREALRPQGASFTGEMVRKDTEFISSPDYWFRPIDVAPGPDGAIYILDFYSPVIAHSDTRGPLHSRSGASVRPDREHYFGRIYRVQAAEPSLPPAPNLASASVPDLMAALRHPNRTVRFNAHRLLLERGGNEVSSSLATAARDEKDAVVRVLELWGLARLEALPNDLLAAGLRAEDPIVRKNAALIVESKRGESHAFRAALAAGVSDADPRVKLAMLRGLASAGLDEESAGAVIGAFPALHDNWSKSAAVAAAARSPEVILAAAFADPHPEGLRELASNVAARVAEKDDPQAVAEIVALTAKPPGTGLLRVAVLEALAKARGNFNAPAEALHTLLSSPDADLRAAALPLAARSSAAAEMKPELRKVSEELLARLRSPNLHDEEAAGVVASVVGATGANPEILPALSRVLANANSPERLKVTIIKALGKSGVAQVGELLATAYGSLSAPAQTAAFDALLSRVEWTASLLDALEKGTIAAAELGSAEVYRLRTYPRREVAERALAMSEILRKPSADKDAIIARLRPIVSQPGDAAHGKELFTQTCAVCHKLNGLGKEVGPVLDGIGAHGPEALLVDIIDPSRQIDSGFELFNVETKDGQMQSGILAQENDSRIVLRSAAGDVEIPISQIKTRTNTHRSLMPEGFEGLGGENLRDILAFITGGESRFRILDLSPVFTADTRRGLFQSQDAINDSLPFRKFGVVKVGEVPFDIASPESSPLGGNVVALQGGGQGSFSHTFPRKVEITVGLPVAKFYFLGGVAGWGAREANPDGVVAMRVTAQFADGQIEVVNLRDGVVFADYIAPISVPGSKYVPNLLRDHQIRTFDFPLKHPGIVEKLILESMGNNIVPVTVAVTAELQK